MRRPGESPVGQHPHDMPPSGYNLEEVMNRATRAGHPDPHLAQAAREWAAEVLAAYPRRTRVFRWPISLLVWVLSVGEFGGYAVVQWTQWRAARRISRVAKHPRS